MTSTPHEPNDAMDEADAQPSTPPLPKVDLPPINRAPADRSTAGYLAGTPGLNDAAATQRDDALGGSGAPDATAGSAMTAGGEGAQLTEGDALPAPAAESIASASATDDTAARLQAGDAPMLRRVAAVSVAVVVGLAAIGGVIWYVMNGSFS